jgi:Protein of unknown function (DUF1688)
MPMSYLQSKAGRFKRTGPIMNETAYLLSTAAVRERCNNILTQVLAGKSHCFTVDLSALPAVGKKVFELTQLRFPKGDIPYHSRWRHFEAGGFNRLVTLPDCGDKAEHARREIDLAVTAVLLDAGAGPQWTYQEQSNSWSAGRSEGLGVAAFHAFAQGLFGGDELAPQANAVSLRQVTSKHIAKAFQVTPTNPLVGLEGRTSLLVRLAGALENNPHYFGPAARPGGMFDYLLEGQNLAANPQVKAADILQVVLNGFGSIWPSDQQHDGQSLGDCWRHRLAGGTGPTSGWVPFHKLSQWMTYSLLEPFERAGVKVVGLEVLTGLPEYRNGGLLIDCGVIQPKQLHLLEATYGVGDEFIVEWRALTVALLDRVASEVRRVANLTEQQLPLACVLEGGTWAAGRITAQDLRAGMPPINVKSDGTVF